MRAGRVREPARCVRFGGEGWGSGVGAGVGGGVLGVGIREAGSRADSPRRLRFAAHVR